jgi:lysozyme
MKPIIDISSYQNPKNINYATLAQQVSGVIIRCAYGSGAYGSSLPDAYFQQHYAEFKKLGVPIGTYHFLTEYQRLDEQIELVMSQITGKTFELGYHADVEFESGATRLTRATVDEYIRRMDEILGRKIGIYTGAWTWNPIYNYEPAHLDRLHWVAGYSESWSDSYLPKGWTDKWLWQYTSSAFLKGYGYRLDANKIYLTDEQFAAMVADPLVVPVSGELPEETHDIPLLSLTPLSQQDPRWKAVKLGTSTSTIGGYGCLLTCATMMLNYYGHPHTPETLNTLLNKNGGYLSGNLFVWGVINKLYPDITLDKYIDCANVAAPLNKIEDALRAGYPAIVQVDYNPYTTAMDMHFVLIIGKQGSSYMMIDPIDGTIRKFEDRYGLPARHIYRIAIYKGVPGIPPEPPEPPEEEEVLYKIEIICDALRIRAGAGTNYAIVGATKKGETWGVLEVKGDWMRIGTGRWVMGIPEYVKLLGKTVEERVTDLEARVSALEGE